MYSDIRLKQQLASRDRTIATLKSNGSPNEDIMKLYDDLRTPEARSPAAKAEQKTNNIKAPDNTADNVNNPIQLEQPQLHFFKVKNEELQDELNDSKQRCCAQRNVL